MGTRKKTKFNLDDEGSDDEGFNFLTHKGQKLDELDDFKQEVPDSDAEYYEDKDLAAGRMNEEMVNALNFGGGEAAEEAPQKKTREERHAEIIEKSKAYKFYAQEIKLANMEATRELDDDFKDLTNLISFKGRGDGKAEHPRDMAKTNEEADVFDNIIT